MHAVQDEIPVGSIECIQLIFYLDLMFMNLIYNIVLYFVWCLRHK